MDISATSALNAYTYQSALKTSGQSSAVLQALTLAYTQRTALPTGEAGASGALESLAGSGSLGSLMGGIYSAATAGGGSTSTFLGALQAGSSDASSISALLGESGSSLAGVSLATTEATAAYAYQQAAATSGASASSYIQTLAANAQTAALISPLNLLA